MAGETESGCLSLHNFEPPAHVILELLSPTGTDEEILTRTSGIVKTGKYISFPRILQSIDDSEHQFLLKWIRDIVLIE